MKNAMQLKGIIKNMAVKTGIKANALLQNYMLERLLERISASEYKWKYSQRRHAHQCHGWIGQQDYHGYGCNY